MKLKPNRKIFTTLIDDTQTKQFLSKKKFCLPKQKKKQKNYILLMFSFVISAKKVQLENEYICLFVLMQNPLDIIIFSFH